MVISQLVSEDLALKRTAWAPRDDKPRYNWSEAVPAKVSDAEQLSIYLENGLNERRQIFSKTIANTVGNALTDVLLSQHIDDIFNSKNKELVTSLTREIIDSIRRRGEQNVDGKKAVVVSPRELTDVIENSLMQHNATQIARSFLMRPNTALNPDSPIQLIAPNPTYQPCSAKLIRRNGKVVDWNPMKIEIAVRKAFLSLEKDSTPAVSVTQAVVDRVSAGQSQYVHIEDIQDMVQEELMRQTHFRVAEHYILYRAEQNRLRRQLGEYTEPPRMDSAQDSMILVRETDGQTYLWDGTELKKRIEFAITNLDLCLTRDEIETELRRSIYNEISEAGLQKTIILNAKSLIERDADFAIFAGRILLSYIYEEVLDWSIASDGIEQIKNAHQHAFSQHLSRGVEIGRINPDMLDFDLDTITRAIDPVTDLDFDYLGIQTLYDRYLIVDKDLHPHRRLETPQFFWMRVAMGLHLGQEKKSAKTTEEIIALYRLYTQRRFCSSTPTLFNSGTIHSQLSSCYLYKVDDSLESIMHRGIAENAFLSKWAGGLGGSWTAVRGTGSHIHGTNGESQGVIPFLKLHNDQLIAVNQGGKRKGSGCAYLETWHNDILDFIELRKNTGDDRRRTHDLNTANWIPDLFMQRLEARADWTLFRSSDVPELHESFGADFVKKYTAAEEKAARGEIHAKKIPAIDLWKAMLKMLFETGHPWITFKDPCNLRSPQKHTGTIHSSNLCTEITLNTSADETAVCNLGSIVIDSHLDANGALDCQLLRATIRTAVRALDSVIDINFYPTAAARTANHRHRPIGLGIMGWQNLLFRKKIPFASEENVQLNDEIFEQIAYYAYEASSDLAAERGSYETFQGSDWSQGILPHDTLDHLQKERGTPIDTPRDSKLDWTPLREKIQKQGMRNSNVIAIAPTATISNIMGSTPCIEPTYKNLFVKSNLSGEFIVLNRQLVRDLKKLGIWTQTTLDQLKYHDGELAQITDIPAELRDLYATAFGIDYTFIIDAAARRQKWIDQSQSLNLFLAEPNIKTLSHMYRRAYHAGLKTTYYLRTLGASDIEKSTIASSKELRGLAARTIADEKIIADDQAAAALACSLEAMLNGEE